VKIIELFPRERIFYAIHRELSNCVAGSQSRRIVAPQLVLELNAD